MLAIWATRRILGDDDDDAAAVRYHYLIELAYRYLFPQDSAAPRLVAAAYFRADTASIGLLRFDSARYAISCRCCRARP